jgi:DNA-directed RNA polymerase subunit H
MSEVKFIKKAKKTIAEMLIDRGYSNNPIIRNILKDDPKEKYSKMGMIEILNDTNTEVSLLNFIVNELGEKSSKFKKDDLLKLAERVNKIHSENNKKIIVIIVFTIKISSQIIKEKQLLNEKNKQSNIPIFFEYWSANDLQFNISKSNLIAKHEIMDPTEVEQLKINYQIKNLIELPRIKLSDPMVKYLGAQPGQVIKIKRISETTGYTDYFRLVG